MPQFGPGTTDWERGQEARHAAAFWRSYVRDEEIEPIRTTSPFRRVPQNIASRLTGGLVPGYPLAAEVERPISREELGANPEWQARFDRLSPQLQAAVMATRPGELVSRPESMQRFFDAAYGSTEKLSPFQSIAGISPTGGAQTLHVAPGVAGPGSQVIDPTVGPVGEAVPFKPLDIEQLHNAYAEGRISRREYEIKLRNLERRGTTQITLPGEEVSAKEAREAGERARHGVRDLARASEIFKRFQVADPRVVGPHAKISGFISPVLAAISPAAGEAASQVFTGTSMRELANLQLEAKSLAASAIPIVT
jgi:hypothetical protein